MRVHFGKALLTASLAYLGASAVLAYAPNIVVDAFGYAVLGAVRVGPTLFYLFNAIGAA
jgi:hypothetical protein